MGTQGDGEAMSSASPPVSDDVESAGQGSEADGNSEAEMVEVSEVLVVEDEPSERTSVEKQEEPPAAPTQGDVEGALQTLARAAPEITMATAPAMFQLGAKYVEARTEQRRIAASSEQDERQHELRETVAGREAELDYQRWRSGAGIERMEALIRASLALLLVVGTAFAVIWGIAKGIPPAKLTQYLVPITGLAGLAVGYFFGRGVPTAPTPSQAERPPAPRDQN